MMHHQLGNMDRRSQQHLHPNSASTMSLAADNAMSEHLAQLHREMANLRMECDRLINKHEMVKRSIEQASTGVAQQETSSAYNTGGDSCQSDSLTPDSHNDQQLPSGPCSPLFGSRRALHRSHAEQTINPQLSAACRGIATSHSALTTLAPPSPRLQRKAMGSFADYNFRFPAPQLSTYTSTAYSNAMASIPSRDIESRLFMFGRPVNDLRDLDETEDSEQPEEDRCQARASGERSTVIQQKSPSEEVQYKWKVKRRCDGSRYVVKRPIRSQVLKKREAQLNKERTGISTDDDAHSAIKLGQFCTREERKKILEKERQRKKKQQQQRVMDMPEANSDQVILSLAHKKQHRRKQNMLLDEFTTTREFLSQRNPLHLRVPAQPGTQPPPIRGIPTVTTV